MPQRLRITFSKGGPARYIAHLDVMRTWERTIRRARLPLAPVGDGEGGGSGWQGFCALIHQ